MAGNTTLGKAKAAKNDEFYSQYADIERKVNAYLAFSPDTFCGNDRADARLHAHIVDGSVNPVVPAQYCQH